MASPSGARESGLGGALLSFVPRFIVESAAARPSDPLEPREERVTAALLQVDLSGFTPLTERLAKSGPEGVEELSRTLSAVFETLIGVIDGHGGDVVKFAGDALTVWWPLDESTDPSRVAVSRAAQCAFELQDVLHTMEVASEYSLTMRAGISVGDVAVLHIGGLMNRWGVALTGDAVMEVGAAQTASGLGEVAVGPRAAEALGLSPAGQSSDPRRVAPSDIPPTDRLTPAPIALSPQLEPLLEPYVASAVRHRLAAGQERWIGELRRLSVIFVDLPDVTDGAPLAESQAMLTDLQDVLYRYEGSFDKLSIDEKGVKLVGVFGLPPFSHEDDPIRAVMAGLEISRRFRAAGRRCSIGISTGRAFCGVLGGETRRDYTVMGDMANLGARLMQAAHGGILCNEETYQASQFRVAFRQSRPIALKGKSQPVIAYSPTGEHERVAERAVGARGQITPMVGRDAEAALLGEALSGLAAGRGAAYLIEGEAGIGKSRLIEHVLSAAADSNLYTVMGAGDAIESSTPYRAWRPIVGSLLGIEHMNDPEERRRHVQEMLAGNEELEPLIPLLNAVLPLHLPQTELTRAMDADVRADNVLFLVSQLVQMKADSEPVLLVIDDAHWIDSNSWLLLRDVFQTVRPLSAIVATRPMDEPYSPELQSFLASCSPDRVELGPLPEGAIAELVCDALGVSSLPDEFLETLHQRTEGHPFFSRELAFYLRNEGMIEMEPSSDGLPKGRLATGSRLSEVEFPESVQVVITSRIDRLEATQQLMLKVASVLGRVFSTAGLRALLPVEVDAAGFDGHLGQLLDADLITQETPGRDPSYAFAHAIVQEVAYGLLLFAQRRDLHRQAAQWFEQIHADDIDRHLALLAHHWLKADDTERAVHYQSRAGEQAVRNFANEEAVAFLGTAIELSERSGSPVDALDRARWELNMGEAQVHWSRFDEGRVHVERALELLGYPVPRGDSGLARAGQLIRALGKQWMRRLRPRSSLVTEPDERTRMLLASRGYTRLVGAAFQSRDTLLAMYSAFTALNLAEKTTPSPELGEALGPVGFSYDAIPIRSATERHLNRAVETGRVLEDASTLSFALLSSATHAIGVADWERATAMGTELVDLGKRMGARKPMNDGLQMLSAVNYSRGMFDSCVEFADELITSASRGHDPRFQAYGYFAKAHALLHLGDATAALDLCIRIPDMLGEESETTDRQLEMMQAGLLAAIQLRLDDPEGAVAAAATALERQAPFSFDLGYALPGYALTADVLLSLWESNPTSAELREKATTACTSLARLARRHEAGRADAFLSRGRKAAIEGRSRRAARHLRSALAAAEEYGLRFHEGRAHLALASVATNEADAQSHRTAAAGLFDELKTPMEAGLARFGGRSA